LVTRTVTVWLRCCRFARFAVLRLRPLLRYCWLVTQLRTLPFTLRLRTRSWVVYPALRLFGYTPRLLRTVRFARLRLRLRCDFVILHVFGLLTLTFTTARFTVWLHGLPVWCAHVVHVYARFYWLHVTLFTVVCGLPRLRFALHRYCVAVYVVYVDLFTYGCYVCRFIVQLLHGLLRFAGCYVRCCTFTHRTFIHVHLRLRFCYMGLVNTGCVYVFAAHPSYVGSRLLRYTFCRLLRGCWLRVTHAFTTRLRSPRRSPRVIYVTFTFVGTPVGLAPFAVTRWLDYLFVAFVTVAHVAFRLRYVARFAFTLRLPVTRYVLRGWLHRAFVTVVHCGCYALFAVRLRCVCLRMRVPRFCRSVGWVRLRCSHVDVYRLPYDALRFVRTRVTRLPRLRLRLRWLHRCVWFTFTRTVCVYAFTFARYHTVCRVGLVVRAVGCVVTGSVCTVTLPHTLRCTVVTLRVWFGSRALRPLVHGYHTFGYCTTRLRSFVAVAFDFAVVTLLLRLLRCVGLRVVYVVYLVTLLPRCCILPHFTHYGYVWFVTTLLPVDAVATVYVRLHVTPRGCYLRYILYGCWLRWFTTFVYGCWFHTLRLRLVTLLRLRPLFTVTFTLRCCVAFTHALRYVPFCSCCLPHVLRLRYVYVFRYYRLILVHVAILLVAFTVHVAHCCLRLDWTRLRFVTLLRYRLLRLRSVTCYVGWLCVTVCLTALHGYAHFLRFVDAVPHVCLRLLRYGLRVCVTTFCPVVARLRLRLRWRFRLRCYRYTCRLFHLRSHIYVAFV